MESAGDYFVGARSYKWAKQPTKQRDAAGLQIVGTLRGM